MSLCCFGKWVWVCHTIQSLLLSPWPTFQPMNGLPSGIVNFLKHMDFQSSHGVSFQRQGCWEKPFSIHTKLKFYHLCCKFGMCFTKMIMYPRFFIPCKKKLGIINSQRCNRCHLLSGFSSIILPSMTIAHLQRCQDTNIQKWMK